MFQHQIHKMDLPVDDTIAAALKETVKKVKLHLEKDEKLTEGLWASLSAAFLPHARELAIRQGLYEFGGVKSRAIALYCAKRAELEDSMKKLLRNHSTKKSKEAQKLLNRVQDAAIRASRNARSKVIAQI